MSDGKNHRRNLRVCVPRERGLSRGGPGSGSGELGGRLTLQGVQCRAEEVGGVPANVRHTGAELLGQYRGT